jgi:hypothetical protein
VELMWMPFKRPAHHPPQAGREASLFRDWIEDPAAAMARLGPQVFSLAEADALAAWDAGQRAWGLGVRLRRDTRGAARLAEILGPDGCVPLALLYRGADGRLRVDDFAGVVRRCDTLEAALETVLECA